MKKLTKKLSVVEGLRERDELLAALEEIVKGEGAFSRDHLEHAKNCIENMRSIARAAIKKARGE